MSVAGAGTLAAVRDVADVTRGDLGKGTDKDANDPAKFRDLLATIIPTLPIAAYSALLSLILTWIEGQTKEGKNPGDFEPARWLLVVGLVLATAYLVGMAHRSRKKANAKGGAALVIATSSLAAGAWGLSGPGTPLALRFEGIGAVVAPVAVLFVVGIILTPLVPKLQKKAS
jgi:hypothetical protein